MGKIMQQGRERASATAFAVPGIALERTPSAVRRSSTFEDSQRREQTAGENSPAPRRPVAEPARPLVVDVDGTLIRSDLLVESFLDLLSRRPFQALAALPKLMSGKAALKSTLAAAAELDCTTLPFNSQVVELMHSAKSAGRPVYLASASDRSLVESVASAVGLVDGIFASDAATNLSGSRKRVALVEAFGNGGFDYVGNSWADIPVWEAAHDVIVIGGTRRLRSNTAERFPGAHCLDAPALTAAPLLRSLRVHQWLKNLLIFAPALAAHQFSVALLGPLLLLFLCFSLLASSAYVTNDLLDLASDRSHARKRHRPLASGRLPLTVAMALAPVLLLLAAAIALTTLPVSAVAVLAGYYLLTMFYSLSLKRKPILDVVALACLYGVRLAGGALAAAVPLSPWFVGFAVFLFLCLAIVKRCTEIVDRMSRGAGDLAGRNYLERDLPMLEAMAAASGYVAIMIFALYINSPAVMVLYHHPEYMWAIALVLFYWISRILLLTHRGQMHDDPVVYAVADRVSLICGALVLAIGVAAS